MIRKSVIFVIAVVWLSVYGQSVTKVLQNGVDGYSGVVDASIPYQMYDHLDPSEDALNHEGEDTLKLKSCLT